MQDNRPVIQKSRNASEQAASTLEDRHFKTFSNFRPPADSKMISLVPEKEPWLSPSLDYSKNVVLTSDYDEYDPQKII